MAGDLHSKQPFENGGDPLVRIVERVMREFDLRLV